MNNAIALISELRIQEAISNGDFDNLLLKGKPLDVEDLSSIPEDMRMAYKILKNSGFISENNDVKSNNPDVCKMMNDEALKTSLKKIKKFEYYKYKCLKTKHALNIAEESKYYQQVISKIKLQEEETNDKC